MGFINLPIFVFSLVLVVSILTSMLSSRANIPLILVFLCIGLLCGDSGLGIVSVFRQPKVAFFVGSVALALILFDSGYQTKLKGNTKNLLPSAILATLGVFLTAVFFAPAVYYLGGFNWTESFLLASVISSTDAAAVFFILRMGGVSVREKIKSTLEMESGSNDPMAIFLTFSFLSLAMGKIPNASFMGLSFLIQMSVGLIAGFFFSRLIRFFLNRINFDTTLYPVLVIGFALLGFATTNLLQGSGFIALYICGILLGQVRLQGHFQILHFQTTLTWLCQSILFLTLGFFAHITTLYQVLDLAFVLSLVLLVFARPLAVFICLWAFKQYTFYEKLFISFVGLRGATSILLALAPCVYLNEGVADKMFSIIFLMVLMSLSIQGLLIVPVAKKCLVILPVLEKPTLKTEIDLPGLKESYLLTYTLTEKTPALLHKKIPKWAMPVYVQRGNLSYNGSNVKTLKAGDKIYVFASSESKLELLDSLYGIEEKEFVQQNMGDFILSPDVVMKDLAYLYDVSIPLSVKDKTLGETLTENFSDLEVGDRFNLGNVEIVIRQKNEDKIIEVGLNLEPSENNLGLTRLLKFKMNK